MEHFQISNRNKYLFLIAWAILTVVLGFLVVKMFQHQYYIVSPIQRRIISPTPTPTKKVSLRIVNQAHAEYKVLVQDDTARVEVSSTSASQIKADVTYPTQAEQIISSVWGKDAELGLAIARCESTDRVDVVNSIGATGLFQILISAHPDVTTSQMQDPLLNTQYAYKMYLQQGTTPWISSRNCWY